VARVSDAGRETVSEAGSDPKLTPELALAYLGELSTDIRAAAVLDDGGAVAAQSGFDDADADQVESLVSDLFDHAITVGRSRSWPAASRSRR
jgi:hypothetical protein